MKTEDQIIEKLLEGDPLGGRPLEERARPSQSDEEATFERLYIELMGLIPQGAEPIEPRPEARGKLMAAIGASTPSASTVGASTAAAKAPVAGSPATADPWPSVADRATRSAQAPPRHPRARAQEVAALPRTRRGSRWVWAVAAMLALALVSTFWVMNARLEEAELVRGRMQAELDRRAESDDVQVRLAALSETLSLITAPGVEACPLRPPSTGATVGTAVEASGVMFTRKGHWYIKISDLGPAPPGTAYQLWFVTDVGSFSGGTFTMSSDGNVELGSPTMPTGTTAAVVTLEPEGGTEQPTGPTILYGSEKMTLI